MRIASLLNMNTAVYKGKGRKYAAFKYFILQAKIIAVQELADF